METARAFTERLAFLLGREHDALAEFLVALADFDRRRVWVELGHSSLWVFLRRELRLSKSAAQYRKVAAELIQEIPGIVEPLRRGDLCLTSIIEAAKVVTADNWQTILPRFYGLSRREAMEVVAELQPHPSPPVRTVVTTVRPDPVSRSDAPAPQAPSLLDGCDPAPLETGDAMPGATSLIVSSPAEPARSLLAPSAPAVTPPGAFEIVPLTAGLSRLHATVSSLFMKKLEAASDALSHTHPNAAPGELLEMGLDLLIAQAAKRRGLAETPQKKPRPSKGDHIPAHVRREVWKRDGGRCQFPLVSGGICGSTRNLELDHIQPRSLGGASTADNLRIACRSHNDLAARLALGDDLMNRYTSGLRGTPRRASSAGASHDARSASPP